VKSSVDLMLHDPASLEGELMGLGLHDLVARLTGPAPVVSDPARETDPTCRVRRLLGTHLPCVLDRGLGELPRDLLERLLHDPGLLLELQEVVLCEGGTHWQRLVISEEKNPPQNLKTTLRPSPESERGSGVSKPAGNRTVRLAAITFLVLAGLGSFAVWYHFGEIHQREQEITALREQLDRPGWQGFAHPLPPPETAEQRLPLLCKALSALSGLPPDEARDAPPDAGSLSLPEAEPALKDDAPMDRAFTLLLDGLRADDEAVADLLAHPQRYLKHDDPAVRHGAGLALEQLRRTRSVPPSETD